MEGTKTDKLDSFKTIILSDASLRCSVEDCVTLYTDFIEPTYYIHKPILNTSSTRIAKKSGRPGYKGGQTKTTKMQWMTGIIISKSIKVSQMIKAIN